MDVESKEAELESVNIGQLLVEARKNQNLSAQDIADRLNLTVAVVEEIEDNQFRQDLPLAFLRGYIRSYGLKVGVDAEMLCNEFDKQTGQSEAPIQNIKRISAFGKKRSEMNSNSTIIKVITFIVVGSIVIFGGWEIWKRVSPKFLSQNESINELELNVGGEETNELGEIILGESDITDADSVDSDLSRSNSEKTLENKPLSLTSNPEQNLPVAQAEADNSEQSFGNNAQSSDTQSSNTRSNNSENNVLDNSKAENETEQQSVSLLASTDESSSVNQSSDEQESDKLDSEESDSGGASNKILLTEPMVEAVFTFDDDCWVSVKDVNGEVLAIGIKKQGKIMPLSGVAPWTVILGEPSVVSLSFEGNPYDLSAYQAGRKAEFKLEK